ncbi:MAG: nuclear transport factor 2 family protein [Acidobacteriia bacterium]|nr:nuclear transport factor 2 family protein [Terriglobia bacterium]
MLRNTSLIVCLTLAVLAVGCSNAPAPPPDTRVADVQAVKNLEAAAAKDANAKDAEKWAGFFAEDASGLFPGAGILNGRAAIKAAIAPLFADPNFSLSLQSTRAMASKGGDMVYLQGTYTMTMTDPKTKKPMTDKGKYLTIFTKQPDRSWKAIADTYNSDSPM